ncbi:MAG: RluA family pseudouridine synthase [Sedimentisphaerales bacterium]|jgi:23S rRNA pseudouridine1911/1915/1917 synthase|nr:RluA family pseudouridine synthase [Sedimentisphaerales bacterium]HNY77849.1 RluA family pseudouridine synthase [Sedimentisphaerales bacterium]HOC63102.1 RluA family pseudouridine synthase [Sedimentisphaerales bacterium]HOH64024.1 RluA family pseudouridine synthase [Sedimentisphaerales bacterium]HPY48274.1 RluA family pseudouridine synthase [Sedimentisphaerales bacterium]
MCELPEVYGQPVTLHVGVSIRERRIDKYLHGRFRNLSRHFLQNAIRSGAVKVNGQPVKPSFKLSHRDVIEFVMPEPEKKEIEPEDIPLDVLYEDDDLIVLNKPPDLIVHPARGNKHGTLVNALAHYSEHLSSGLGEFRPGIVHRLDRNTTGVMVVTKHDMAQWKVAKQFELRQVEKSYLAIVHGTPELTADRIDAPLGVHPKIREKYSIRPETGKEAVTFYEVVEAFRGFSLIHCKPRTGRTHQIRVHLSHLKHPIVADDMYGGKLVYPWQLADAEPAVEEPVIGRCALHAWTLGFTHPTTGQRVRFEAPLPADMQHLLDLLRRHRAV